MEKRNVRKTQRDRKSSAPYNSEVANIEAQQIALAELQRRLEQQQMRVAEAKRAVGKERLAPRVGEYVEQVESVLANAEKLLSQIDKLTADRAELDALSWQHGVGGLIDVPSLSRVAGAIRAARVAIDVYAGRRYSVVSETPPQMRVQWINEDGKREFISPEEAGRRRAATTKKYRLWSGALVEG